MLLLLPLLLLLLLSAYFGSLLKGAEVKEDQARRRGGGRGRGRALKAEGKGAHSPHTREARVKRSKGNRNAAARLLRVGLCRALLCHWSYVLGADWGLPAQSSDVAIARPADNSGARVAARRGFRRQGGW